MFSGSTHHCSSDAGRKLRSRRGFALLITITLLAFLVLLLVSLASLTRVETQVASNNQQLSQARQNALMALNVAIGQLQKYAGPDNVTTARADILTSTPANAANFGAFYTGVWGPAQAHSAVTTGLPRAVSPLMTWLVSGNETTPLSRTPADAASAVDDIFLVDKIVGQQNALKVRVRKQAIMSTNVPGQGSASTTIGHFAYWVGDESVKAKINLVDPYGSWTATTNGTPSMSAHTPDPATEKVYRLLTAQRYGIEQVGKTLAGTAPLGVDYAVADNTSADFRRDLMKLSDYRQIKFLPNYSSFTGANDIAVNRFHDLTTSSYGLLTNATTDVPPDEVPVPPRGGLREDLTWHFESAVSPLIGKRINYIYPNNQFSVVNTWDNIRRFYNLADQIRPLAVNSPTANTFTGDVLDSETTPAPVMVQFRLFFNSNPDGKIRMRVAFVVGNPYNTSLSMPNGLCFTFDSPNPGASTFTVTNAQASSVPAAGNFNVLDQLKNGGTGGALYSYRVPGPITFNAGEAKVFTLNGTTTLPAVGGAIQLREGLDVASGILLVPSWTNPNTALVTFANTTDSKFQVSLWNNQAPVSGQLPLQCYTEQPWSFRDETQAVAGGRLRLLVAGDVEDDNSIFYLRNFRSSLCRTSVFSIFEPSFARFESAFSDDLSSLLPINWAYSSTVAKGFPSLVLYDVPVRNSRKEPAVMSIAQLQHVNLGNNSANFGAGIGNSKTNTQFYNVSNLYKLNAGGNTDIPFAFNEVLWDRYMFSTVPQLAGDFNPATDVLPNARFELKSSRPRDQITQADLTRDQYSAARFLMVNGPFNVNSTSVEAWKALLGSTKRLGLNGESVAGSSYFRTVHQPGNSANARNLTKADAWNGYVNWTDAEITNLATEMVAQVKVRGPFSSLAQFVNRKSNFGGPDEADAYTISGALQSAIDKFINNLPSNKQTYLGIPGYLTQADVLQSIGPVLTTRSDTFIIRAYGDSTNPADPSLVQSRAYCEAIVQRMQDPVETTGAAPAVSGGTSPDYIKPPGVMGRRFVVVGFRWLTAEDI